MTPGRRFAIAIAVWAELTASGAAQAPALEKTHAEVLGKWIGSVVATMGEMPIDVTVKVDGKKVIGEIANPHGVFSITDVKATDGKWVMTFRTDDGAIGKMVGKVTDGVFKGEWDLSPRTTGTFELKRPKKGTAGAL